MRNAAFPCLYLILVSFFTLRRVPAQSNPAPSESPRPTAKLPENPKDIEPARTMTLADLLDRLPPDLREKLAKLPPTSKVVVVPPQLTADGIQFQQGFTSQDTCAHILIQKAPANVDPKTVLKVPDDFASNMPIFRGLPLCAQDVRNEVPIAVYSSPAHRDGILALPPSPPKQPKP
jgi:hypothetical protein